MPSWTLRRHYCRIHGTWKQDMEHKNGITAVCMEYGTWNLETGIWNMEYGFKDLPQKDKITRHAQLEHGKLNMQH